MSLGNKEIMAKNIQHYIELNGLTASKVCADLNIAPATFSDWTHARTYPRIDKIEMLANYFHIAKYELVEDTSLMDFMVFNGENSFMLEKSPRVKKTINQKTAEGLFKELTEEQQKMIIDLMKNMK